ncbi:hypothetical protein BVRB_6g147550 [Beta vulgaris subsp. vulgaris]|nr:hypothetical protein BVRB_6g147550 [Beta vulgaris subsp. vulgaris]
MSALLQIPAEMEQYLQFQAVNNFHKQRDPTYYYVCGVIGNIERDFLAVDEADKIGENQWGTWLRASPRRGRQRIEDEAKQFLDCARALCFAPTGKELGMEGGSVSTPAPRTQLGEVSTGHGEELVLKKSHVAPPPCMDSPTLAHISSSNMFKFASSPCSDNGRACKFNIAKKNGALGAVSNKTILGNNLHVSNDNFLNIMGPTIGLLVGMSGDISKEGLDILLEGVEERLHVHAEGTANRKEKGGGM